MEMWNIASYVFNFMLPSVQIAQKSETLCDKNLT